MNMDEFMRIDLDEFLNQKDINLQWSSFREKLSEASDMFILKVTIDKNSKTISTNKY